MYAAVAMPGGGYQLAGHTGHRSGHGDTDGRWDGWISRLDADGQVLWQQVHEGPSYSHFYDAFSEPDGGAYLVGSYVPEGTGPEYGWIVHVDAEGAILSERTLGDELVAVGFAPEPPSGVDTDLWVVKLDAAGETLWLHRYGFSGDDEGLDVVEARDRSLLVAGRSSATNGAWMLRLGAGGQLEAGCPTPSSNTSTGSDAGFGQTDVDVPEATTAASVYPASLSESNASGSLATQCVGSPTEVSPPGSPQPLVFLDHQTLGWEDPLGNNTDRFNIYRGDLPELMPFLYGACHLGDVASTTAIVSEGPAPGFGFTYLIAGENAVGEGGLGFASSGARRPNGMSCP